MFRVISKVSVSEISNLVNTYHNDKKRNNRMNKIYGIGIGKPLYSFIVDTAHYNGNEIHTITDNGIIVIQNERTKKLVTCLIARAGQIRRYFNNGIIPYNMNKVILIAIEHQKNGYNNW